jgi:hypothetical protein
LLSGRPLDAAYYQRLRLCYVTVILLRVDGLFSDRDLLICRSAQIERYHRVN